MSFPPVSGGGSGGGGVPLTIANKSGNYSVQAADALGTVLNSTDGAPQTFTLQTTANVPVSIGDLVYFQQGGAGVLTIAGAAGVTVNSDTGTLTLAGQYAWACATYIGADVWTLSGDLTPGGAARYDVLYQGTARLAAGSSTVVYVGPSSARGNGTIDTGEVVFKLDPTRWATVAGASGLLRIALLMSSNATDPAADFTLSLLPVTASAGSSGVITLTFGAAVATAVVTHAQLGASVLAAETLSAEFACPATGAYALSLLPSTGTAVNSLAAYRASVLRRLV